MPVKVRLNRWAVLAELLFLLGFRELIGDPTFAVITLCEIKIEGCGRTPGGPGEADHRGDPFELGGIAFMNTIERQQKPAASHYPKQTSHVVCDPLGVVKPDLR